MEKVIRDGEVAVLYSPGFGAGWYTWNDEDKPEILFHPKLVEIVEAGRQREIDNEWVKENLGLSGIYCGGASTLAIKWLPQGMAFEVQEYDGAENILTIDMIKLIA